MTSPNIKLKPFRTPRLVIDTKQRGSHETPKCWVYAEWTAKGQVHNPECSTRDLSKRGAKFVMKDGVLHVYRPVKSKPGLTLEAAIKIHGPKFKVSDLRLQDSKEPKFVLAKATDKERAQYAAWSKAVDAWYKNHVRSEFKRLLARRRASVESQIKYVDRVQRDLDEAQNQLDADEAAVQKFLADFN